MHTLRAEREALFSTRLAELLRIVGHEPAATTPATSLVSAG